MAKLTVARGGSGPSLWPHLATEVILAGIFVDQLRVLQGPARLPGGEARRDLKMSRHIKAQPLPSLHPCVGPSAVSSSEILYPTVCLAHNLLGSVVNFHEYTSCMPRLPSEDRFLNLGPSPLYL